MSLWLNDVYFGHLQQDDAENQMLFTEVGDLADEIMEEHQQCDALCEHLAAMEGLQNFDAAHTPGAYPDPEPNHPEPVAAPADDLHPSDTESEKKFSLPPPRQLSQTELVVKLQQGIEDNVPVGDCPNRIKYILPSGLTPFWQSSILLTDILKSLGCTSEALLILERLELWDGVIECYKQLGQMDKAETLIRRLLFS